MVLSTPAFSDGGVIPNRHTQVQQAERGISPQLVWTNAPAATQSFVVHMRDPEVARNRTTDDQVHWLVWNIPATEKGLPEGMPEGAELPNGIRQISASGNVYRGPGAPAAGPMHHYTFEVYALDAKLDVPPAADAWETPAQSLQGDGRPRHRQSGDGRHVQETSVGSRRSVGRVGSTKSAIPPSFATICYNPHRVLPYIHSIHQLTESRVPRVVRFTRGRSE